MASAGMITVDVTGTDLFRELVALTKDMLEALPPERQSEFVGRVMAISARQDVELKRSEQRLRDGKG